METLDIQNLSEEQLEALLNEKRAAKVAQEKQEREAYESLKTQTVRELVLDAQGLSKVLKAFKDKAFEQMKTQYDLLCKYSKRHEGGKGNFTLELAEGIRVKFSNQDLGFFDERSAQAEKHIIDFVNSHYKDHGRTKQLITSLLERKKGKLDIKLVQKLYAMEETFDDQNWKEGIRLLKESWTSSESKSYITFESKVDGEWQNINLNFSSI